MELITAALQLAEGAAETVEAAAEVGADIMGSKGLEAVGGMGVLEEEIANHMCMETGGSMGVLETQMNHKGGNQISFGSLAGKNLEADSRYTCWKDGVSYSEISREWMDELANEISDIFGKDQIDLLRIPFYRNAAMAPDLGVMIYDPVFMKKVANECGQDSIISVFSHEVGHRLVNTLGLERDVSLVENEACSDYIAGLVARLSGLNPEHMVRCYGMYNKNFFSPTDDYPSTFTRINAFLSGYSRIDRGPEAAPLKAFENFRGIYDQFNIYHDKDLLKQILMEDVVNPIRSGAL